MLRGLVRFVVFIAVVAVLGVLVVALLGGALRFGVGVAACPVPPLVLQEAGPVPAWLRGGYEISIVVQVGEFVFDEAGRLVIEEDTVQIEAGGC